MTWASLPLDVRVVAERELTDKQLEVFRLECNNFGTMRIARRCGITRSAVLDRLHNAHIKLLNLGLRQNASGDWYVEEAA